MKNVNGSAKLIAMISVLTALVFAPTSSAIAGSNGQQIGIVACNAARVVIQGHNQDGKLTRYTLNNPGCGRVYVRDMWWKGLTSLTAYYTVSQEAQNYNGQSVSVSVPASQTNNDWYFVNFSTPTSQQWIMWRAQTWVNDNVPYVYGGGNRDSYRQDCSGYVSFAWQTGAPGSGTSQLESSRFSYPISFGALKAGDALVTDADGGHIILFDQWVDQGSGTFMGYEENSYSPGGAPGVAQRHQITLLGGYLVAPGGYSYPGRYIAIRKNGL